MTTSQHSGPEAPGGFGLKGRFTATPPAGPRTQGFRPPPGLPSQPPCQHPEDSAQGQPGRWNDVPVMLGLSPDPALRAPATTPRPPPPSPWVSGGSFSPTPVTHRPDRGSGRPRLPTGAGAPGPPGFGPPPGRQRRWLSPAAAAPHRPLGPAPGAAHWVRINNKMAASRGGGGRAS